MGSRRIPRHAGDHPRSRAGSYSQRRIPATGSGSESDRRLRYPLWRDIRPLDHCDVYRGGLHKSEEPACQAGGEVTRRTMDLGGLDLNLLVALDALFAEKSVSRAGERLHLSQSATSGALARLREVFRDPLLVPVG